MAARSGHRVEIVYIHDAGGGFVMIAPHEDFPQVTATGSHVIGTGSVAHDVPQVHDHVERRSGGEGGFEGFEIRVDVAYQQYSQGSGSPDKLPIIDSAARIILGSVKPRSSGRGYKRLGSHVTGEVFLLLNAQFTFSRC